MERVLPENPLTFIQTCVKLGSITWTYHVNMRLKDRFIPREAILKSVDSFEVIETYPEDKYLPSYLVYTHFEGSALHVVFGANVPEQSVRIVTAYRPTPEEWSKDFKKRK